MLEELRLAKQALVELDSRAGAIRQLLLEVVDDDEDVRGMMLSSKAQTPEEFEEEEDEAACKGHSFHSALKVHNALEPLQRAIMTHVPGTVAAKYVLHGLGQINSPRVRLPLVGPEDHEAAAIESGIDQVVSVPGLSFSNFRPDRNAAAGGALPKVAGTTR